MEVDLEVYLGTWYADKHLILEYPECAPEYDVSLPVQV